VPIKKISNKSLSRNFRPKKTPLRVLPLGTPNGSWLQNHKKEQCQKLKVLPKPAVRCSIENVEPVKRKHYKKPAGQKVPIRVLPFVTVRCTLKTFKWVLLSIFMVLASGICILLLQDGFTSLKNVFLYSVMGFCTFFMGYFGLVFARDCVKILNEKIHLHQDTEVHT